MKLVEVSRNEKLKILRVNPYFDDLPEDVLKVIATQTQLREYERGDMLFWEGDPCAGLHIIQSGSVKLYRISPQGRQYIIAVLTEGATCNEVPAFDGGTNPVNVEALETSRVWVVDALTLRELVKSNPEFALKILSKFGQNLRNLVHKVSEMAFYQVTHRLARLITELPVDESRPHWTQEQLAARLGTVREVVSRSLKELEKSGAIRIEDRRIHIKDGDVLRQWTQPYN
ncbi:MAG: Crp/Fnr family transcriptional regulator [Anaerolineales bacterium]|nr:Crp/Fnr family transcriptional regulator [Anaerolineales bacterium]NUQ84091.1 Crp/Fnr family transcriptional regulator [Anaerolineales bacterium]